MLAALNPQINLTLQNRDAPGSEIENYLTNGGRSVPKLIVRQNGKDLFTWGPRSKEAQETHLNSVKDANMTFEDKKAALQNWYNKDKGQSMQIELYSLFKSLPA